MEKLLFNLGGYLMKKYCNHENKTEKFKCYEDRYIEYWCDDCQSFIFEDMDY